MDKVSEEQLLSWALRGNTEAISFCQIIFNCSQMLDDLYDGDKAVDKDTAVATFWNILIALPKNSFYMNNIRELTPSIQRSLVDWIDANALEQGSEQDKTVAYVLRDSVSALLVDCAYLVGGYEWGRSVGAHIRREIHNETLEDYIKGLEPTKEVE